jgi:hypothetical protein
MLDPAYGPSLVRVSDFAEDFVFAPRLWPFPRPSCSDTPPAELVFPLVQGRRDQFFLAEDVFMLDPVY